MEQIEYQIKPESINVIGEHKLYNFNIGDNNIDITTVEAFGDEWTKFSHFSNEEIETIATQHYFDIVKPEWIVNKQVLDVGCGTGRWTKYVAKYAATVDAVDPSKAIEAAAVLLSDCNNVRLSRTSVDNLPFANESFDFVFSLGVLHHIPDTQLAMTRCVDKLKTNGYFLTYLYYKFENRGFAFKALFSVADIIRQITSRLPPFAKNLICDFIAIVIYFPFIICGWVLKKMGLNKLSQKTPLHFYIGKTFNVIRNDARDRFGTPLEQRFTKDEIRVMMENSGLTDIVFSEKETYWHSIGRKK